MPLADADDVGLHAGVLNRPPLAGASHARLHLVRHQQNAVPVADAPQLLHEHRRRNHVSALALDWLHKDCRHFLRRQDGLEQLLFDVARTAQGERLALLRTAHTTAIHVRIAHVRHTRNQRTKAPLLLRLRGRQRYRSHRASVKRAQERDHVLPLGVVARQLERAFHGLGARVAVVNLVRPLHGRDLRQPLRQRHHALVVEIGARHVDQLARLLLNRGDDFRMAVSGRGHGNSRREVQKLVAIHVFHDHASAAFRHHGIRTRVRRRNIAVVTFKDALGVGPGQGSPDLRVRQLESKYWWSWSSPAKWLGHGGRAEFPACLGLRILHCGMTHPGRA